MLGVGEKSRRLVSGEVMDARFSLLFWTDWGKHAMIKRAWMNGEHAMILVRHRLVWPNGLVIDFVHNLLYWADAQLNQLESVDLHGQSRYEPRGDWRDRTGMRHRGTRGTEPV